MTDPNISLEDQIATQQRLVELYDVDKDKNNYDLYRQRIESAILASLKELQAIRSAEMPVEPRFLPVMRKLAAKNLSGSEDAILIRYIDSLQSALQRAQENVKKWQSLAEGNIKLNTVIQKRAEQAEKDRDACYASLEATRSKLHEITAFVNDNASPQRESEQERDAFARAIRESSAK